MLHGLSRPLSLALFLPTNAWRERIFGNRHLIGDALADTLELLPNPVEAALFLARS